LPWAAGSARNATRNAEPTAAKIRVRMDISHSVVLTTCRPPTCGRRLSVSLDLIVTLKSA
jgi:hypothetical protein